MVKQKLATRTAERRSNPYSFNLRDAIYIAAFLVSLGIQWARVGNVENRLTTLESRYAVEVVPRQEHMQMNNVTEERWRSVGDRLTHVEGQLEGIQKQLLEIQSGTHR